MSGDILVTPQELRDHSGAIKVQAEHTTSDFNSMKSRLQQLSTQFRGQAATAFDTHWNDWHTHAAGLIQALEGLGQFLESSANTIEDVDRQIASGLNG
jgi:Uncharacterized protein conserved in bacteria